MEMRAEETHAYNINKFNCHEYYTGVVRAHTPLALYAPPCCNVCIKKTPCVAMYHKDEERKPFSMAMAAHKSPIQSMSSNWSAMDVLCIVIHHITHNLC